MGRAQRFWVQRMRDVFEQPMNVEMGCVGLLSREVLIDLGGALRAHHAFSHEPCSKDRFEFALEQSCLLNEVYASLAPKGNPGHDITIRESRVSLKTQANAGIKRDAIWISKFHELGKGTWGEDVADLIGLREQFIEHLSRYETVLVLRCFGRGPEWRYELIEVPVGLLARAREGRFEMRSESKQMPRPGYCHVEVDGARLFSLYFDGGTERKLQIKGLRVDACRLLCRWRFSVPPLTPGVGAEPW